jgi:hypothetical protein
MSMQAREDVRYLLRTVVDEGRSLVRVHQQWRNDNALKKVAVVTDDVQKFEQDLAARHDDLRPDVADALVNFERRYRAIETSLPQDDVLVMWIQGELTGRIASFVETSGLVQIARDDA